MNGYTLIGLIGYADRLGGKCGITTDGYSHASA
ncbi:Uncharacterised protein [Pseudomonas fluorescens]|uniref:Uncharacterized protein n=1 Tax=Pseudomonas fluorescens TaxID=294 RepID=A0A448DZ84_PSEFL|nr:Uncharacterised protein [Pseudomonas fluorescens]